MQPFIPDPATRVQQILSNSVDKSSSSSTSTTTTTRNEPRRSRSPERLKRDPPDAKQARKWCEVEAPEPEPVLKEGDRVVWLQDGAQHGVVKFVGKLKRSGNQLMAGIAMVSCSNSCKVFFLTLLGIISTSLLLFVALRVLDEHVHVKYLWPVL